MISLKDMPASPVEILSSAVRARAAARPVSLNRDVAVRGLQFFLAAGVMFGLSRLWMTGLSYLAVCWGWLSHPIESFSQHDTSLLWLLPSRAVVGLTAVLAACAGVVVARKLIGRAICIVKDAHSRVKLALVFVVGGWVLASLVVSAVEGDLIVLYWRGGYPLLMLVVELSLFGLGVLLTFKLARRLGAQL